MAAVKNEAPTLAIPSLDDMEFGDSSPQPSSARVRDTTSDCKREIKTETPRDTPNVKSEDGGSHVGLHYDSGDDSGGPDDVFAPRRVQEYRSR